MANKLVYSKIIQNYSQPKENDFGKEVSRIINSNSIKLIILDDDPTGIQTVHGCVLVTSWEPEVLRKAFEDPVNFFYVLTNTRAKNEDEAASITRQAVENILEINENFGFKLIFISRSDSTLRGHFPLEPEIIKNVLFEKGFNVSLPIFFIPCFLEAGRYSINNQHYLKENDELIPVKDTEFARDNVFGYKSSQLQEYIIEKSGNSIKEHEIGTISIEMLRTSSFGDISHAIDKLKNSKYIVVNAMDYYDLKIFSFGLLEHFKNINGSIVLRTSSSLPKAISGIEDKTLFSKHELKTTNKQGIFIVGSHVNKTTLQLKKLLKANNAVGIEIDVQKILDANSELLTDILKNIKELWNNSKTPVIYTSRKEVRIENKEKRQEFGKTVSDFLVSIVKNLPSQPGYIVAKGGITSHDILTHGLELTNARVAGQILTGVPVIIAGKESRFPRLPYVIFPGNVGDENSLLEAFNILA